MWNKKFRRCSGILQTLTNNMVLLALLYPFTFHRRSRRGPCRCGPTSTVSWRSLPILCTWTIPTMCCSLRSAYVTWSSGWATTSAGTLGWDPRCAAARLSWPGCVKQSVLMCRSTSRNRFTSATKICWPNVPSCRKEWTSCSEKSPTAQPHRPLSAPVPPHAPSLQCRPLFESFLDLCAPLGSDALIHDDCFDTFTGPVALEKGLCHTDLLQPFLCYRDGRAGFI